MTDYKSADVQRLFDVSSETVRRWAQEFEQYLSPTATPGKGRARQFTADDLTVFALVSEIKNSGGTYDDVHLALKSGQRGSIEDAAQERALDIRANVEVDFIRKKMEQLQVDHNRAVEQVKTLEGEVIRFQTELKQMDEVKSELQASRDMINNLNREIGKLEAQLEMAKGQSE